VGGVIVLATLPVEDQGRPRLRRKAFDAVRALGGDRDVAARVGAEVSDALRAVERPGRRVHVVVSVDPRSWGATLAFLVAWSETESDALGAPPHDAAATSRTLTYRLRVPPIADEGLERVRRTLAARSREELFASLEATNEALRRSTAEARLAGAAKAQFLANMSHEIRTPMNAIVGMNRLALGTELSERQRGYLEKIESSTRHLLGIIDDVLDLSKLEAGKLTLERGEVVLGRLLDDVATLVGGACADKGLRLTVDVAEEVPGAFQGDALRLRQVLVNLVNNAVKFTAEGEVAIGVQRLPAPADETALRFTVRDTGIGLSQAQIAHLFTSFAQADATITRRYGGTGLGLAICKSLVELMRGEVGVESRPGEGSTFWFTARFGAADVRAEARVLRPDLQGRRALVVDDVAASRQTLRRLLERMGLHVEEAGSGHAALRLLTASAANEARADAEGARPRGTTSSSSTPRCPTSTASRPRRGSAASRCGAAPGSS
jgi:signal transduction histidine kinase